MVDLNVLKPSKPREQEESIEELGSLICTSYDNIDVQEMVALEEELSTLFQYLKLDTLTSLTLDELHQVGILSEEAIDMVKVRKGIVNSAKNVGNSLAKFAAWVHNTLQNKTVTEKYILKRFAKLEQALSSAETSRGYVKDVPTYDVIQKRLVGILQVCDFIKELSSQQDTTGGYNDGIFEKVALTSNGVLKLTAPYSDSTYRNLEWSKPQVSNYEVLKSPWNNATNLQKLRNLVVEAKYESLEDLASAAKVLAKRCSKFREETAYAAPDYNDVANTYNAAYVINKMVKQINHAINKEINTLVISYITHLINYTTI